MNGIRQDQHGIELLVSRETGGAGDAVHLLPAWLLGSGMEEIADVLLCGGSHLRDILGSEDVDADEGDGKVEGGEDDIDPEGVPAVGAYEVLQPLRERSVWRQEMGVGAVAVGWRWRTCCGEACIEMMEWARGGRRRRREGGKACCEGQEGTRDAR